MTDEPSVSFYWAETPDSENTDFVTFNSGRFDKGHLSVSDHTDWAGIEITRSVARNLGSTLLEWGGGETDGR